MVQFSEEQRLKESGSQLLIELVNNMEFFRRSISLSCLR
jgi:hypothetical protein